MGFKDKAGCNKLNCRSLLNSSNRIISLGNTPINLLSFSISATLLMKTQFCQSDFSRVFDSTYLVTSLTLGQYSACSGRKDSNILNVFLPNRRSAGCICFCITLPETSSLWGTVQPPYLKPPGCIFLGCAWRVYYTGKVIVDKKIIFLIVV
jgi:hypothetical protein